MLRIDFNLVLTIINLIVLYLGLRKFLIGPVTNVMEQRKQMIEGQIADNSCFARSWTLWKSGKR